MNETTSPAPEATPAEKPTWWARLQEAFWYTGKGPVAVLIAVVLCLVALGSLLLRMAGDAAPPPGPLTDLAVRVEALERMAAPQPAEQPAPMPDPQPPRASAPRAALRPSQTIPPAAAPAGWGTTDLDRAIAAFPSTNLLEQAK
jgi:hypothetical protein